jgi:hypothetical protein
MSDAAGPTRRRRSAWRTVALFAVIGLIINVLLAWMFALTASPNQFHEVTLSTPVEDLPSMWQSTVPPDWPNVQSRVWGDSRGLSWRSGKASRHEGSSVTDYSMLEVQVGWPLRTLRWRHGQVVDRNAGTQETIGGWWIPVPTWLEYLVSTSTEPFHARRRIPIEPLWPGVFQNSAYYAIGLWLLLRFRRVIRHWLRRHHKQCLECGYPIGIRDRCSECGSPLAVNPAVNLIVADRP